MKKFIAICALIAGFSAGEARAQETEISVDAGLDAVYAYIWRGGILGSDKDVALQPSITLGFGDSGLALNIWGSAFLKNRSSGKTLEGADELDFTLSYDTTTGEDDKIGVSIGFIEYTFPNGASDQKHSEEVYGSLSLDHQLAPSVTVYYDFGLVDDYYATAGINPEFPMGEGDNAPVFSLGASIAISGDGYGGSAGFNDFTVSGSIGWTRENWSFGPFGGYSYADDGINADNSSFWGGVSLSYSK